MSTHIDNIEHIENAHFHNSDKPSLPSNIPSPKGFIGREVELAALRQAKTGGKTSFVLHGIGGVGKTDLALKFIEEIKADYSSHIRVDMFGLSDKPTTANVARLEVIRTFKPDIPANLEDKDINNLYISLLNQHKTILFFDNAKDREQVEPLNNASAFVVITSRATFNVSSGFSLPVEQMSPADARNLLYKITNDEARYNGQADALAYLAGYLPMALLPLGSLLAEYDTLEAVDLVAKYKDRKERLQLADPNRENLTVMASFDLSYERLSEELQTCWRKLAVFPADFDLEAMQAVWQIEDGKVIRDELVKKHLLEFNKDTKRFHLHDLSRDYTGEKLTDEERLQTEFLYSQHFGFFLASLKNATIENLNKFDFEQTNIKHGFTWLLDKVESNKVMAKICDDYIGYLGANQILSIRLKYSEYIGWLIIGLKASRKLKDKQSKANCLGNLGLAYYRLGKHISAIKFYKKALKISREIGDQRNEGAWLSNLGVSYDNLGEYLTAIRYHEKALIIANKIGDQQGQGNRLGNLGISFNSLGKYKTAIDYFKKAMTIAIEINDRHNEGIWLDNLGVAYKNLNYYKKSIDYHYKALSIAIEICDKQTEGDIYSNLGNVFACLGKKEKSKEFYLQSITILESIESCNAELVRLNLAKLE
jgi:tetratricopeptide (TPR) repeat protein